MSARMAVYMVFVYFLVLSAAPGAAAEPAAEDTVTVTADYIYTPPQKEPEETARALALFGARYKAAALGAKFLSHKGLLVHFGNRQREILCLAADQIEAVILEKRLDSETGLFAVRIRSTIDATDFIRAEIADQALEKEENGLSFRDEMEQPVSGELRPGKELSRAYRYLRKKQWRIAVIYLDHLQEKYPYWGEVYLAKALGFYSLNQTVMMADALKTACRLNNQEACQDLEGLSPVSGPPSK